MTSETRPISPNSFAAAIEDLPVENLYTKAVEIDNSVAHLERSNRTLQEYSDSIKNDESLDAETRQYGDKDCLEAIRENEVVIERQQERVRLLRAEVERRGQRWHGAEPKEIESSNGHTDQTANTGSRDVPASSIQAPARLTNEELRRQMEARLGEDAGDGEDLVFADVQIDSSSAPIDLKTKKSSPVARPEPDLLKLTPPIMIRNGPRPSAIHVPVSNNATHDIDELRTISPDNTQNTVGVGRLAIRSPFTPGPTTAVYYREATPCTPAPTIAVYHGSASGVPKHEPTTWQGRFTFFDHFPPEIRERIYRYLIEDVVVIVNAVNCHSVRAFKRQPLRNYRMNFSYITLPYRPVLHPNTNWLSLSRQFFFEARKVFWRSMIVRFERRWDFINASLKGTLVANASKSTPSGMDAPTLFPLRTDVMSHVRELHLNLTTGTDFDGRVTTAEASRVTTSMLEIIEQGMPLLQGLRFVVDDRSRLSNSIIAFLPDAWFLEALLAIKHVDTVSFASGPGWRGHSQNKKNARSCLCAMNAVLAGHFAAQHPVLKLDADGIAGVKLQARLGRRMLFYIHAHHELKDTLNALAMKVVMLESNI